MKKILNAFGLIIISVLTACICSCSLVLPNGNDGENNTAEKKGAMCGLFMVFYDGDKAITEENFTKDEAIKLYFGKHYYNEETDDYYLETGSGRNVFSDVAYNYKTNRLDDKLIGYDVAITASLHYTKALTEYKMHTYNIYFDEEQRSYYISDLNVDINWSGLSSIEQSQSIKLYDQSPEGVLYNFEIEINLVEINNVTQLNIIEFDGENNVVKKTDNYLSTDYQTSEGCQYVIIEEISPDGENGNIIQRTLIDKNEDADATFNYYIADKYGLAENHKLEINFPN